MPAMMSMWLNQSRRLTNLAKSNTTDVIKNRSRPIHDTVKKNNLSLFRKKALKKEISKQGRKIAVLKSTLNLFAQLYVALQNCDGDMKEFFSQCFLPALSMFGQLRLANATSDLLKCLLQRDKGQYESLTQFDCKVLDGAVIIHCLQTIEASTFDKNADIHTAFSIAAQKMQTYRCCMVHIRGRQPLESNK